MLASIGSDLKRQLVCWLRLLDEVGERQLGEAFLLADLHFLQAVADDLDGLGSSQLGAGRRCAPGPNRGKCQSTDNHVS
jgi:hypothetical protein